MNRSMDVTPGPVAPRGRRAAGRRGFSLRMLTLSLTAVMALLTVSATTVAAASPWVQQSTTCLIGPDLDPGHVYWHSKTGKTTCKRD
jgi:hypothetical protein